MESKIKKLLNKENWEIKKLGEIATDIYSGNGVTKKQLDTGEFPAVKCGDISKFSVKFDQCISFVDPGLIKNKKYFEKGDLLISGGGSSNVGKCCVYLGSEKVLAGGKIIVVKHKQNPEFLSYVFSSKYCKKQVKECSKGVDIYNLNISLIKKIKIPLPPLEIQEKIVNYLDKWTELKKELNEELNEELNYRKKQYQYYKELLLSSGRDKWDVKTLEEIATDIYSGNEVIKEQLDTGNYPAVSNENLSEFSIEFNKCINFVDPSLIKNKRYCEKGDLLISDHGSSNVGKCCVYLGSEKCLVGNNITVIKHKANPKFLSYIFSSKFCRSQIRKYIDGTAQKYLKISTIRKIKIPLPSLEEQKKIVEKLNMFHTITESLEEGIPKLLDLTRRQYDYYKNEILSDLKK